MKFFDQQRKYITIIFIPLLIVINLGVYSHIGSFSHYKEGLFAFNDFINCLVITIIIFFVLFLVVGLENIEQVKKT